MRRAWGGVVRWPWVRRKRFGRMMASRDSWRLVARDLEVLAGNRKLALKRARKRAEEAESGAKRLTKRLQEAPVTRVEIVNWADRPQEPPKRAKGPTGPWCGEE